MQRVIAVEAGDDALAWTLEAVSSDDAAAVTTPAEINGAPAVFFWKPGQSSALEAASVAEGREVGTVGLFASTVNDELLTFRAEGENFIDNETNSTWNIVGTSIDGPLAGTQLAPITFVRTFWFSWSTFRPDTTLVDSKP